MVRAFSKCPADRLTLRRDRHSTIPRVLQPGQVDVYIEYFLRPVRQFRPSDCDNGQRFPPARRDIIFAVAIYCTIHLAVNFAAIMAPANVRRRERVDRCRGNAGVRLGSTRRKFPAALFPLLEKRRGRMFNFNHPGKNRPIAAPVYPRGATVPRPLGFTSARPFRILPRHSARRTARCSPRRRGEKRGIINGRPGILLNRGTEIKAAIAEMSWRRVFTAGMRARLNEAIKNSGGGTKPHLYRG